MKIENHKLWVLVTCVGLSMACARVQDQPTVSEEDRARMIIQDNASGFARCEQIRAEADAALSEVVDLMEKGDWTAANKLQQSKAGPGTRKFVECVASEKAVLLQKLKDGGVADTTAESAYQDWLTQRDAEVGKKAADPPTNGNK